MFSILNHALCWAITSFGNEFCLKKRLRLIKALDNRFYVKFMQLEIGLFSPILSMFCVNGRLRLMMADQGRSDFYAVFTMSLYAF